MTEYSQIEKKCLLALLRNDPKSEATDLQRDALAFMRSSIEADLNVDQSVVPNTIFGVKTEQSWLETKNSLYERIKNPDDFDEILGNAMGGASKDGILAYTKCLKLNKVGFAVFLSGRLGDRYLVGVLTSGYAGSNADVRNISDSQNILQTDAAQFNADINNINITQENDIRIVLNPNSVHSRASLVVRVGNKSHVLRLPPVDELSE